MTRYKDRYPLNLKSPELVRELKIEALNNGITFNTLVLQAIEKSYPELWDRAQTAIKNRTDEVRA